MADFMSVQPVGGMGNAVRPTPTAPQPLVAKPAESSASGSSGNYSSARDSEKSTSDARLAAERRPFDDNVLTGPPPSFEASLLEVEGNLDAMIRRIEQARERTQANEATATAAASKKTGETQASDGATKTSGTVESGASQDKSLDEPVAAKSVAQPVTSPTIDSSAPSSAGIAAG